MKIIAAARSHDDDDGNTGMILVFLDWCAGSLLVFSFSLRNAFSQSIHSVAEYYYDYWDL